MEEILPRLGWLLCAGQPRVKCGRADLRIFLDLKMTKPNYKPTLNLTNPNGYWTTRGYANSRIANSRTGQLAD